MDDAERLKLLHGPYAPPKCRRGDTLHCEYRDRDVKVGGMTDAPIQWPRALKTGKASPIVCGDLVRAIRTESEISVAHHWGVSATLVWYWKKALDVPRITEGTERLYREYKPEKLTDDVAAAGREAARAPDANERRRRSKSGKAAHPHTRAALLEACKRPKSEEWRRQARERMKGKTVPLPPWLKPWTIAEDVELGTAPDRDVAARIGRTVNAVRCRRRSLGIPPHHQQED